MYTGGMLLGSVVRVVCCAYVGYIWQRYRKHVAAKQSSSARFRIRVQGLGFGFRV
jgi:hypothetical protein